ncbi:hypothetical protein N7478_007830 [Penicillium angulare]|uniref:uncharacterized protein n=1 Tax=Penicillium angulare TaxID=116970 RepID=UPI0025417FAB|nr:uncharacterized protein N7478_007830 [Penicillium angulare]KAJ5272705.1 hypothetical protein N7478_007830 [Penicillium angulare]
MPIDPKSVLGRYRQLAPSASVRVSPLCLGTMTFGGTHPEKYGVCTKEEAFAMMDFFYENGGNFFDTANSYQDGQSEIWLGEWITSRKNRDELVIATKYTSGYMLHHEDKIQANFVGTGTKSMRHSVDESLRKLQLTYIDLFYVHWWDFTTSIPELMQSLNHLVVSGKVNYLGISDTPAWVVVKANAYARQHGLRQFSVYQGKWNAARRDHERDIVPMCADEGMGLAPYATLNAGNFQTVEGYKAREKVNTGRNFIPVCARDKQVAAILEKIANNHSEDVTLLNIALAYICHKAPYVFPIVGGRTVDHLKGSIPGLAVTLSQEEIDEIDTGYEFDHGFPHSFLSGTLFDLSHPRGAAGPEDVWLTKPCGPFDWVERPKPIKPNPSV